MVMSRIGRCDKRQDDCSEEEAFGERLHGAGQINRRGVIPRGNEPGRLPDELSTKPKWRWPQKNVPAKSFHLDHRVSHLPVRGRPTFIDGEGLYERQGGLVSAWDRIGLLTLN